MCLERTLGSLPRSLCQNELKPPGSVPDTALFWEGEGVSEKWVEGTAIMHKFDVVQDESPPPPHVWERSTGKMEDFCPMRRSLKPIYIRFYHYMLKFKWYITISGSKDCFTSQLRVELYVQTLNGILIMKAHVQCHALTFSFCSKLQYSRSRLRHFCWNQTISAF